MDYEIQIFKHEKFKQIRGLLIDGEPWFVGKDVALALGYKNGSRDVNRHVDLEDRLEYRIGISGQRRKVTLINESGLYSMIFGSQLPEAKEFKHWVTSEVLPSIRKTGSYSLNAQDADTQDADTKAILLEILDTVNSLTDTRQILREFRDALQQTAQIQKKNRKIECGKILGKMIFALKNSETKERIAKLTTNLLLDEKVF